MNMLVAFLHHLAAFTIVSTLLAELVLMYQPFSLASAKSLRAIDAVYGLCAMLIIVLGVLRVMYFEKGPEYYLHNPTFMLKMTAFAVVGLLSAYPTIIFLRWGKSLKQNQLPELTPKQTQNIKGILKLELLGIAVILFGAVLMAKGYRF